MSQDILAQYPQMPQVAKDFFAAQGGLVQRNIQSNSSGSVSEFNFKGHDQGLAYTFFIHAEKNNIKSESENVEINDDLEMVGWRKGKEFIVERVTMLSEILLKFAKVKNEKGQMVLVQPLKCIGGKMKEDYDLWKASKQAVGLDLSRWNQATNSQVKTLNSQGVYTVEQLASMNPDSQIRGIYPTWCIELHTRAIHFVNAQAGIVDAKARAEEMFEMQQTNAKLLARIEALEVVKLKDGEAAPAVKLKKSKHAPPTADESEATDSELEAQLEKFDLD